jgi:hypothetical protein
MAMKLTPRAFASTWRAVDTVGAILPALNAMAAAEPEDIPLTLPRVG